MKTGTPLVAPGPVACFRGLSAPGTMGRGPKSRSACEWRVLGTAQAVGKGPQRELAPAGTRGSTRGRIDPGVYLSGNWRGEHI